VTKLTKSSRPKRKVIRRITIRLTTCDEMALRRMARMDKKKPSVIVRDFIRSAELGLETIGEVARATGRTESEVSETIQAALAVAVRSCIETMKAAATAEDLL
jgi:hypothetical protein